MAEIRHLENRHDIIFLCWGWSDLDKISQTGAEWHVDCGDMVKIETTCRIPIWRTFGRIPWHVIPELRVTLQGAATRRIQRHVIPEPHITLQCAATWRIQCYDPRATCHIAGCCHRANSTACQPRATYHIAGCCHLVNSLSLFQSHMPHFRVQSTGEMNVMIVHGVIIPSAILKIVFRHILYFFLFFNAVWALTSGGSRILYRLRDICYY